MTKKIVVSLLIVTALARIPSTVSGLEYIVTNTVGGYNTPLNTTTNKLDLGDNPVAKTIYLYIKYSQAEANLVNDTGGTGSFAAGLYGGSFKLTFATTTVAGRVGQQVSITPTADLTTFSAVAGAPYPVLRVATSLTSLFGKTKSASLRGRYLISVSMICPKIFS
jgi:hypothetical protein